MADDAPETGAAPLPRIGSYQLVEPLGSGGMSSVYRATHVDTGHVVAVKVLPRSLAKNSTLLQRFLREAKSAEALEDANIVAIYDHGADSGRHYLVLEYVPGGDLHDLVRDGGPMALADAVDAVRQVCQGLRHAASRGLIHRDIKPANILRTPDGRVKITDLGLAVQMEAEDERMTRDGTTVGTVDYMAPEQARDSRATSIKSDIYSLGCMFYYLLTGRAPFTGKDIVEKLRAHATAPPPDVRKARPDAPEILARLLKRMLAKRPEKRFDDYDQLLDALDAVAATLARPADATKPPPLAALIDDEDEDEDHGGPLQALIDDEGDEPRPLAALIDEDDDPPRSLVALIDDDDSFDLGPGPARSPASTVASPSPSPSPRAAGSGARKAIEPKAATGELDIAGLAALDEGAPIRPKERKTPSASGARPTPPPHDPYDLEGEPGPTPHLYETRQRYSEGPPLSTWIVRGILAGVVLSLLGFGWTQLSPYLSEAVPEAGSTPGTDENGKDGGEPAVPDLTGRAAPPWQEPPDRYAAVASEPAVPDEALGRLGMPDAAGEKPTRDEAPFVTVRRVDPVRDADHVAVLPRAFEKLGGTVQIADDGPFFEDDLRIAGKSRVVRAKGGYRPIIVLGVPESTATKTRPAAVVLNRQDLVIEGIDFVINGADLSPRQESLFLCRESGLTLRDCTITVVGPVKHAYAIVQVGERGMVNNPPASRVRFERTAIRGEASALRLAGAAEVTFSRSSLACGSAAAVEIAGEAKAARSIAIFRTVVASRGSCVDLVGTAGSAGAVAPTIRSFESTFAAVAGSGPAAPFVALKEVPPGPPRSGAPVTWRGEGNSFAGWSAWSSASPRGILASLRDMAPDADRKSRETTRPWPADAADPWASAVVEADLASPSARVARQSPRLREKSLDGFTRLAIGGVSNPGQSTKELTFQADDPKWNGDLGRFLADRPKDAARRVHVRATGSGRHAMTPVTMPEGVSLDVEVAPPPSGGQPLTWDTAEGSSGEALFSVKRAALSLTGVRLTLTPRSHLNLLVSVDQGNLSLLRSILTGPGEVEPGPGQVGSGGGGLVAFRTEGTRPYPEASGVARFVVDRPSCLLTDSVLITGGDAVLADVGRAVVSLANCAISAGSSALTLRPQRVRRDRFEADLVLDHCTIAAERNVVLLDAWPGLTPGPDRPWVVWSNACFFSDAYERGANPSRGVMLRSAPEGLSRGSLAWQSSRDGLDLAHYTAGGATPPPPGTRSDIRREWFALWGPGRVTTPGASNVRFPVGRLKPGSVSPGDLSLVDPNGRRGLDVGADLGRVGVLPTPPVGSRPSPER